MNKDFFCFITDGMSEFVITITSFIKRLNQCLMSFFVQFQGCYRLKGFETFHFMFCASILISSFLKLILCFSFRYSSPEIRYLRRRDKYRSCILVICSLRASNFALRTSVGSFISSFGTRTGQYVEAPAWIS